MKKTTAKIDRSNLLIRLAIMTRRWRQVLDREFRSAGLTDATWRPLLHLYHLGDGTHQKELAAAVGIEGPSLVRLLEALIARGLIERRQDSLDRRAKQLFLTAEGHALVDRIQETVAALESELLSDFSDSAIARGLEFIELLEKSVNGIHRRCRR